MFDTSHYGVLRVHQEDQVLHVKLHELELSEMRVGEIHAELGELFSRLRDEMEIRVVVVTGEPENTFMREPAWLAEIEFDPSMGIKFNNAAQQFRTLTATLQFHESIAALEKPVIARVNGDVLGLSSSILFACDLAIAAEDALIADTHMMRRGKGGTPWGLPIVPGDGGAALLPSHMSPMRAKEYLMLARHYTGRELAELGVINRAVPRAELDAAVDEMVQQLLDRPAYALAWTKRVASRHLRRDIDTGLDSAIGYEVLNFYQGEAAGYEMESAL